MYYFFYFTPALLVVTADAIYHGKDASILDFPYQVSIEGYLGPFCGGSIISKNWVVTSARCMYSSTEYDRVRAGTDLRKSGGSLHRVEKHILYDNYSSIITHNVLNIALIRVHPPFVFDETRQPIPLFDTGEKLAPGTMANVSGFGMIKRDPFVLPKQLQWIEVPVLSLERCNRTYGDSYGKYLPEEGSICTGYYEESGKNACLLDDGDPLVVNGRLAGFMTYLVSCDKPESPVLYNEIAYHRKWIDQQLLN